MMDPFNPHPGSAPGEHNPDERYQMQRDGGKTTAWVAVAFFGGIGLLVLLASL